MKIYYFYYFTYFLIGCFLFQLIYSKNIWFFFTGNIISQIVYILLDKILINQKKLQFIHKTLGWFFIEHVWEDYQKHTGKFFLTNKDFRQKLTLNVFILFRNIVFWSYFTTLFEFACILLILTFLSYILFLYFFYDTKKTKLKKLVLLVFYFVLSTILALKLTEFTCSDIYYVLKPLFFFVQFIISIYCIIIYISLLLHLFIHFLYNFKIDFLSYIYLILKTIFYFGFATLCLTCIVHILILNHKTSNNFLQEFFLLILYIIYLFFYFIK